MPSKGHTSSRLKLGDGTKSQVRPQTHLTVSSGSAFPFLLNSSQPASKGMNSSLGSEDPRASITLCAACCQLLFSDPLLGTTTGTYRNNFFSNTICWDHTQFKACTLDCSCHFLLYVVVCDCVEYSMVDRGDIEIRNLIRLFGRPLSLLLHLLH